MSKQSNYERQIYTRAETQTLWSGCPQNRLWTGVIKEPVNVGICGGAAEANRVENKRYLGKGHPASFLCERDLAIVLRELDLLKEAERHGRSVLEECEKTLQTDDSISLASRYDFSRTLAIKDDLWRHRADRTKTDD